MKSELLMTLTEAGDYPALQDAWLTIVTDANCSAEEAAGLADVISRLAEARQTELAEVLALTALEDLPTRAGAPAAAAVASAYLRALPNSDPLRTQTATLYRRAFADRPGIEELLAESGVEGGRPVRRALRTLEVCLAIAPGAFLVGRHEDITARVRDVTADWHVEVDSTNGVRRYGPVELADNFAPAPPDDYRVLRDFDPERLQELLAKDPLAVLGRLIRSADGRLDSDQLQELLCPSVIPPESWSKWWTKARTALKRNPHFRLHGRSPYIIEYDERGTTLEAETEDKVRRLRDTPALVDAVDGYLRECKARRQNPDAKFLRRLRAEWVARAERIEQSGGTANLEPWLLVRRLDTLLDAPPTPAHAVQLLAAASDPTEAIAAIDTPALWPDACDCLADAHPQGQTAVLASLLPRAPRSACEDVARRLVEQGWTAADFDDVHRSILRSPGQCVDALLWLWEGPSRPEMRGQVTPLVLLNQILGLLADVKRNDDIPSPIAKAIQAKCRAALAARKYESFGACLEGIEQGMAATLKTRIARLDNVGRVIKEDMLAVLRRRFPGLEVVKRTPPWLQEESLYVTAAGVAKKEAEVDELVNVKMKENARAIGAAAERGDLSENSEYKFALEERDLLRARVAQLQNALAKARIISPHEIPDDHVGIGCRVYLRREDTGQEFEMTFLGPFDADIDRHIYNYQAPIGQRLMGRLVGDLVELDVADPPGRYRIERIESAVG